MRKIAFAMNFRGRIWARVCPFPFWKYLFSCGFSGSQKLIDFSSLARKNEGFPNSHLRGFLYLKVVTYSFSSGESCAKTRSGYARDLFHIPALRACRKYAWVYIEIYGDVSPYDFVAREECQFRERAKWSAPWHWLPWHPRLFPGIHRISDNFVDERFSWEKLRGKGEWCLAWIGIVALLILLSGAWRVGEVFDKKTGHNRGFSYL